MHWKLARIFLLSKKWKLPKSLFHGWPFSYCQNSKKFISRLHCQIKIPFLLHMIASTFPHHPPRNKNFSMHTPWVKNFLLSKNSKNGSNKFISRLHTQLKFFCLLHVIAQSYPYNPSRNKNFSVHTPWDKNFLLSKKWKFSKNLK